jgi:hypothetical protein
LHAQRRSRRNIYGIGWGITNVLMSSGLRKKADGERLTACRWCSSNRRGRLPAKSYSALGVAVAGPLLELPRNDFRQ